MRVGIPVNLGALTCPGWGETACVIAVLEPDLPVLGSLGHASISRSMGQELQPKLETTQTYKSQLNSSCVCVYCLSRALKFFESQGERTAGMSQSRFCAFPQTSMPIRGD